MIIILSFDAKQLNLNVSLETLELGWHIMPNLYVSTDLMISDTIQNCLRMEYCIRKLMSVFLALKV